MKTNRRIAGIVFVSLFLFRLCFADWAKDDKNLDLRISTAKDTFIVGEPVQVIVTMHNKGNIPAEVYPRKDCFCLHFSSDNKEFSVFDKYDRTITPEYEIPLPKILPRINPNDTLTMDWKFFVLYNHKTKNLVFPKAGTYYIKVHYGFCESNILPIRIVDLTGIDKTVFEKYDMVRIAELIQNPDYFYTYKTINIDELKEILAEYPQSTYSPWIKEALINYLQKKPNKKVEENLKIPQTR